MKKLLSRRTFSQSLVSIGASAPILSHSAFDLSWLGLSKATSHNELWLSAQGQSQDQYGLGYINPIQQSSTDISAQFRGHGLAKNPVLPEQVIMFGRRPGTQGLRINVATGKADGHFNCAEDRHMQGHGCYSADGKLLFCTESEISSGKGKVTVRDSQSLALINEFDSFGIGPHEIALMPDTTTLVIANGGLLTHPDSGRKVLNLESMRSSLSYIDSRTGALISEHFVAEEKASIRHLDVAADGTVALALQVQRQAMNNHALTPLAAIHKFGQAIQMLHAPEALTTKLNDYMGLSLIHI